MADGIWMPFGVLRGVSSGICALDMGPQLARGRGSLGFFLPNLFEWLFWVYF